VISFLAISGDFSLGGGIASFSDPAPAQEEVAYVCNVTSCAESYGHYCAKDRDIHHKEFALAPRPASDRLPVPCRVSSSPPLSGVRSRRPAKHNFFFLNAKRKVRRVIPGVRKGRLEEGLLL
jgi:hypothetical protein